MSLLKASKNKAGSLVAQIYMSLQSRTLFVKVGRWIKMSSGNHFMPSVLHFHSGGHSLTFHYGSLPNYSPFSSLVLSSGSWPQVEVYLASLVSVLPGFWLALSQAPWGNSLVFTITFACLWKNNNKAQAGTHTHSQP